MTTPSPGPYETLGVSPDASDEELRAAYRRLVQLHHPDHNGGSAESARRFEAIQDAYAQARAFRSQAPRAQPNARAKPSSRSERKPPSSDPNLDARLSDLERAVREAQQARERAQRAARAAQAEANAEKRPSDEELGYVTTDDSFTSIFADALDELAHRLKRE